MFRFLCFGLILISLNQIVIADDELKALNIAALRQAIDNGVEPIYRSNLAIARNLENINSSISVSEISELVKKNFVAIAAENEVRIDQQKLIIALLKAGQNQKGPNDIYISSALFNEIDTLLEESLQKVYGYMESLLAYQHVMWTNREYLKVDAKGNVWLPLTFGTEFYAAKHNMIDQCAGAQQYFEQLQNVTNTLAGHLHNQVGSEFLTFASNVLGENASFYGTIASGIRVLLKEYSKLGVGIKNGFVKIVPHHLLQAYTGGMAKFANFLTNLDNNNILMKKIN